MKKILLLLVFLNTILFSVTQIEIADTSYFRVNKDSGGCGACSSVQIPSLERPSYINFPQDIFCGTMTVPTGYIWDSCSVNKTYTAGTCEEGANGRDSNGDFIWACSIPYSYVPKYTLTYHCQKLDLPIVQRPFSSDGVTPMEINPDTCEWIEPCIPPTDRTLSTYATSQECQNDITNLSSIYPNLANSLYCHSCDPDSSVTMYQRTVTCLMDYSPSVRADSGGALVCIPSALANGGVKVNVPESDCVSGSLIQDFDSGFQSSSLVWDTSSNSCYMVEVYPITCQQYEDKYLNDGVCDLDLNNITFSCQDPINSDTSALFVPICKPKNELVNKSPCEEEEAKAKALCEAQNMKLVGNCADNGIIITSSDFDCIENVPNCKGYHEFLNSSLNICSCESGYSRNAYGDCWKDLDENVTLEQIEQDKKDQEDFAQQDDQNDLLEEQNDKQDDIDIKLKTQNDTLAGLREDINTTNNLLNDIKDALDNNDTEIPLSLEDTDTTDIDNALAILDNLKNQYTQFYSNVENQIQTVTQQYDSAKGVFENGILNTVNRGGSSDADCFTAVIWGQTISFSLCPFLSAVAPIFYFILTSFGMFFIFFFLVKNLLRSFD